MESTITKKTALRNIHAHSKYSHKDWFDCNDRSESIQTLITDIILKK